MQHPLLSLEKLTAEQGETILPELITLLQEVVESNASIGFLPPLSDEAAQTYWHSVFEDIAQQSRCVLIARLAGVVVGGVQLELAGKANARHRAEVQKLIVHPQQQRQGIGRFLMLEVEQLARRLERSLLVLDTRQGDKAEHLYRSLGYQEAGVIPAYARNAAGELEATVLFYKQL